MSAGPDFIACVGIDVRLTVARSREALPTERAAVWLPAHMSAQVSLEIAQESLVFSTQVASHHHFFNLLALEHPSYCDEMVVFLQVFIRLEPVVSEDDLTSHLIWLRLLLVHIYFTQYFCKF